MRRVGLSTINWRAGSFRGQRMRQVDLETELGCQLFATCEREADLLAVITKNFIILHLWLPVNQTQASPTMRGREARHRKAHHTWRSLKQKRNAS